MIVSGASASERRSVSKRAASAVTVVDTRVASALISSVHSRRWRSLSCFDVVEALLKAEGLVQIGPRRIQSRLEFAGAVLAELRDRVAELVEALAQGGVGADQGDAGIGAPRGGCLRVAAGAAAR